MGDAVACAGVNELVVFTFVKGMWLAESSPATTACFRLYFVNSAIPQNAILPEVSYKSVRDASGQTTWHGSTNQIYGHHKWSSQSDCKLIEALVSYNVLAIDYGKERGIKRV